MVEFIERKFTTALEFLNALRLSNPEWWPYHAVTQSSDQDWQREWIFRGQGSDWSLLPAAWRSVSVNDGEPLGRVKQGMWNRQEFRNAVQLKTSQINYPASFKLPATDVVRQRTAEIALQAFAEVQLINEFTQLADETGFKVDDLPKWTRTTAFVSQYVDTVFPPSKKVDSKRLINILQDVDNWIWLQPAVALAQHHGIPTRLLDWTRNPLAAAFFAAAQVENVHAEDQLVVYALHKEVSKSHIRFVDVPASRNDFLRAQSGVFTFDAKGDELYRLNGNYPSLNESVTYIGAIFNEIVKPKKLTLSVSQAPELLRLLWIERITQAHLMPTLDHVAQAVMTKAKLSGNTIAVEKPHDEIQRRHH